VVGLGQITELMLPAYRAHPGIEIAALFDPDAGRLARWAGDLPGAAPCTDLAQLLARDLDVVDVLVPTPRHAEVVTEVLAAGVHVQVQKPIARDLEGAGRMLAAARAAGTRLSVLEDYLCYPPLVRLKELLDEGAIGTPVGCHLKIMATGRGGWEVRPESLAWQFEQARDGRGMLVFDHGWHQLAVAHWLFGPVRRIFGWVGTTEIVPGIVMDAPSTLVWEHRSGVRVVLDITFALDTYFHSDFYGGDERVEVTGSEGYLRCNRISAAGIQEPSLVLYREGETRGFHSLADTPPDAFAAMARRSVAYLTGETPDPVMDGDTATTVLRTLVAGLESSRTGRVVDLEAG
jgi:predicted dehydrogenase